MLYLNDKTDRTGSGYKTDPDNWYRVDSVSLADQLDWVADPHPTTDGMEAYSARKVQKLIVIEGVIVAESLAKLFDLKVDLATYFDAGYLSGVYGPTESFQMLKFQRPTTDTATWSDGLADLMYVARPRSSTFPISSSVTGNSALFRVELVAADPRCYAQAQSQVIRSGCQRPTPPIHVAALPGDTQRRTSKPVPAGSRSANGATMGRDSAIIGSERKACAGAVMSMSLRVTIWNEFRCERERDDVRTVYPDGMHKPIADYLRLHGVAVRIATFDEPEHGLSEAVLAEAEHRAREMLIAAEAEGRRTGEAQRQAAQVAAEGEAQSIIARAQAEAVRLQRVGQKPISAAVARAIAMVIGSAHET